MSTEMSSVTSAPSSPAPSCFDREISFSPTLIDRGRIDEGFYMSLSALATHLFLFNSLLWTDKTKWLVAWLCNPPTFLFVSNRQSDNLSKRTSLILNIPVCSAQAKWLAPYRACELILNNYSVLALQGPMVLGKGIITFGGGEVRRCVLELCSHSEGLSGGPCLAGRRDEWLAPALEAPDGQAGANASGVRGPCASADCVRILAERRCTASRCYSAACSHEDENSSWARDESKYSHAPDAVLTCRESVAVIQIGSESMDRSQSEIGFGIWSAYLGEVKVAAHQKVQFNHILGQVSCSAKKVIF